MSPAALPRDVFVFLPAERQQRASEKFCRCFCMAAGGAGLPCHVRPTGVDLLTAYPGLWQQLTSFVGRAILLFCRKTRRECSQGFRRKEVFFGITRLETEAFDRSEHTTSWLLRGSSLRKEQHVPSCNDVERLSIRWTFLVKPTSFSTNHHLMYHMCPCARHHLLFCCRDRVGRDRNGRRARGKTCQP